MSLPANIYAKNLSHFGFGLPLYIPEPPPGQESVRIGDVGYILDGCFYRLFNATCTEDDPINSQGVPPHFEILPLEGEALHHVKKALPPGHVLHSTSVSEVQGTVDVAAGASNASGGLTYRFSCSEQEGALLVTKDHASSTQIHPRNNRFISYMRTHYMNWWVFANEKRGISLSPEDIVLVRGWTKTTQWAVAAKMRTSSAHELSFHADASSFANATFSVGFSNSQASSIMHRAGPDADDLQDGAQGQDQCIFLGYFKLKRSSLFKQRVKIFAMAEPQDDNHPPPPPEVDGWDNVRHDSDSEDIETENAYQPHWDPLDEVLDYILQDSQADVAIASHLSLRDLEWPKDNNIGSVLRKSMPEVVLDASAQVGMLSAETRELSPDPYPESYTAPIHRGPSALAPSIDDSQHAIEATTRNTIIPVARGVPEGYPEPTWLEPSLDGVHPDATSRTLLLQEHLRRLSIHQGDCDSPSGQPLILPRTSPGAPPSGPPRLEREASPGPGPRAPRSDKPLHPPKEHQHCGPTFESTNPQPQTPFFHDLPREGKKALCTGISYLGQERDLERRVNDTKTSKNILPQFGFHEDDITISIDDTDEPNPRPTNHNILRAMPLHLVHNAQLGGDTSIFHSSGRGEQIPPIPNGIEGDTPAIVD